MLSHFESYHLSSGYMRKRHFECVKQGPGLSWRMPSITGTAVAGGKQPWLVIKAATHLRVLRLISC